MTDDPKHRLKIVEQLTQQAFDMLELAKELIPDGFGGLWNAVNDAAYQSDAAREAIVRERDRQSPD